MNPWCVPFPLESLRTLCAQLQQLEHFAIEIHWPMLREQWFLSVPKFSLQISDDLRPFVWPVDEDRLMQYLFDFSELDDSTSKYVDLTEVSVSDGFLLSLVEVGNLVLIEKRQGSCLYKQGKNLIGWRRLTQPTLRIL